MQASRRFYGGLLGLKELTGDAVDDTLKDLVATGKVANFVTPDGLILDLFYAPDLDPPDPDPEKSFTRAASVIVSVSFSHSRNSSFELNTLKPCPAWMTPY
jgi:hypothetical protein